MARRSSRPRGTPAARTPRAPLGRALPLGSGVVLLAGLATYASLLRAASFPEIAAVLAVGVAVVATVVALTRPEAPARRGTFPLPVRTAPPTSARVDSAFVCSKCETYAAPPDWEALLKEFEPSRDLEGHGDEKPHITPAAVADPVWPRWPIPAAPATAAAAVAPPASGELDVAGRWTPMGWSAEAAASLIGSEAALDAIGADARSVSGGRRLPSPDPAVAATPPEELPAPMVGAPAAVSVAPASGLLVADFPSLEQWISTESAGLVARAPRTELALPDSDRGPGRPRGSHCAYCRTEVEDLEQSSRCTDCHRPVCLPCEDSLLEHGGERFCSPCAINRLGADLLRTIEEPVSLGGSGAFARSGARRARPRRRSSLAAGAPRSRAARPKRGAAVFPPAPTAPAQPVDGAPRPPSAEPSPPEEFPTKGIPDPVL